MAGYPDGGTVLDPFGGNGTTAGVALAHGRKAILCELNPDYAALVPDWIQWVLDHYGKRRPANDNQLERAVSAVSEWRNEAGTNRTPHAPSGLQEYQGLTNDFQEYQGLSRNLNGAWIQGDSGHEKPAKSLDLRDFCVVAEEGLEPPTRGL